MENNYAREFDWNDEIAQDSEFLLLPEGDYYFTVESFESARHLIDRIAAVGWRVPKNIDPKTYIPN